MTILTEQKLSSDSLLQIAENLYRVYPDSALIYAEKALIIAQQSGNNLAIAKALRQKATSLRMMGEYEKALEININALDIAKSLGATIEMIRNINDIGDIYALESNYKWATEEYLKALKMSQEINYTQGIARSLNDLGSINEATGQLQKALEYWQKSMLISTKINDGYGVGIAQKNIALAVFKQEQYSKALYYIRKASKNFLRINNTPRYVASLVTMSEIFQVLREYDSAFIYAQKAFSLGKFHQDRHKESLAAINMGSIYSLQNKEALALKYLHYGYRVAKKYHHQRLAQMAAEKLYALHKDHHQQDSALLYHELLMIVKDSLLDIEKTRQITTLQLSYDLETKHKELEQKEQIIKEQKLMTVGLIFFSSLLALLAFSFYFQQRKLNKQNTVLEVQNKKISVQAEQMTELNATKDKIFSILSHDLRSPLQNLQGITELLIVDTTLLSNDEIKEIATTIHQQTDSVLVVLENLLLWSLGQMKGKKQDFKVMNAFNCTQEAVNLLANIAQNKDIAILNEIPAETEVYADENQFKAIIRNLLANAIKFTPKNGRVRISSEEQESYLQLNVTDTGIGMTTEQATKLFNAKTHFSTKGTESERGTGLGLLLVKDFVEQNGGTISVSSKPHNGTTFSFTLKLAEK
ncbi:MAG: tetratricopeptide repeat-containing sensor histidine kinase [Thermoflexibacteraceae bacterium]